MIRRFLNDARGNFAITLAIVAPVLLGLAGLAVDLTVFRSQKVAMQDAADQAALAAIREVAMQGWDNEVAESVVRRFVSETLKRATMTQGDYDTLVEVDEAHNSLHVTLRQDGHGFFVIGMFKKDLQIEVQSEAALASASNICVLALSGDDDGAVRVEGLARLTAENCAVISNSVDKEGLRVEKGGVLKAETVCSAGGFKGNPLLVDPNPVTDCPVVKDPLAGRPPPGYGACDHDDFSINRSQVIYPGVYCGGLRVNGEAHVVARPGEYVVKDGPFSIQGNSSFEGENVGFFLTGDTATTRFANSTSIKLTAPKTGSLAGILVFEDRNSEKGRVFEISSKEAETLIGTFYLPKGNLLVRGDSLFAGSSAWTAIVANKVEVENGPDIKLNSDYSSSEIPVPAGISAESAQVYLTR